MKYILLIISSAYALEFNQMVENLKQLSPDSYPVKINDYLEYFEKEIDRRNYFCQGEISKEEKNICKDEIKKIRINFLNSVYLARKNYLNYLHDQRVKELEEEKQTMLNMAN